jgi:hypothetical protein
MRYAREGLQRWRNFLASLLDTQVHVPFLACRRGVKRLFAMIPIPRDDLIGHEKVGVLANGSDGAIGCLTMVGREEDRAFAKGFG